MTGYYHDKDLKHFNPAQSEPGPMAHEPDAHFPGWTPLRAFLLIGTPLLIMCLVLLSCWAWKFDVFDESVNKDVLYFTFTPEPTITPIPSTTPYPTFTHTPEPIIGEAITIFSPTVETSVIYEKVTVEPLVITEIVTVIITATPEPKRQTSTPNAFATQQAHAASIQRTQEAQNTWLRGFLFFIVIPFVFFAFAGWLVWRWFIARDALLEAHSGETDMDGIKNNPHDLSDIPVNKHQSGYPTFSELERIKIYMADHPEASQSEIEQAIYGYSGGIAWRKVLNALQLLGTTPPLTYSDDAYGST